MAEAGEAARLVGHLGVLETGAGGRVSMKRRVTVIDESVAGWT